MSVGEGSVLWQPPPRFVERANLTRFMSWLSQHRGLSFESYDDLWRWSVEDLDGFWACLWDYFEIIADRRFDRVRSGSDMLSTRWFEGARTNYAEHILRHEQKAASTDIALFHTSERRPSSTTTWCQLGAAVRTLATRLRALGIKPGDRIVSYLPNVEETVIAMLATVAIGAVWSSAAPEFGVSTVIDRFGQINPKLIFVTDGYRFGGKDHDRRAEARQIAAALPDLQHVVWIPYLGLIESDALGEREMLWDSLLDGPPVAPEEFAFERVDSDHPLWILFSSGTTGLPKAIVHGHAGMIAEHLKVVSFHLNLRPGSALFFYTTTGWMMWNSVVSALIVGATGVLYDGNPAYPDIGKLWQIASEAKVTSFGASPGLVEMMRAAKLEPGQRYDLGSLDCILLGGAPSTPETFSWLYENVGENLWVVSTSGGTEVCSALVGAVAIRPVRAGEIQGPQLGILAECWSDDGERLIDEVGELVITRPFPSMPLYFWNDPEGRRYRETYFDQFPGIWRHGDLAKESRHNGFYIYGRSDATLNRHGVRIGTAEIYRTLEAIEEVGDGLVVSCEPPGSSAVMILFVRLAPGTTLSDQLRRSIANRLRADNSPRHVPDMIVEAPDIPYTLTGKRLEVPIRKILMGADPATSANRDAMANPGLLDWYIQFSRSPQWRSAIGPAPKPEAGLGRK